MSFIVSLILTLKVCAKYSSESRVHYVTLNIDSVQTLESEVSEHNQNQQDCDSCGIVEREFGQNGRMNLWILVALYSLSGVPSVLTRDCSDITCIRSSEDLKANYKCDRLSFAGGHNLFLRYNLGLARSDIQAVYYNISIGNTNYTSKLEHTSTNECCDPSNKYCKVHLVYSSVIFYNIHPRMLYYLISFHWTRKEDIFNYPQFCWSPSTFCDKDDAENILMDFTSEVC